jgi:glycosyltransferase 2 family protein
MITLIPATPGGAGVAEISFSALMCDLTSPGLVPIMALMWRMVSFYPYLLMGLIFIPRWMGRVYRR